MKPIKENLKKIKNSETISSFSVLLSGSVMAQVITFLMSIVLTRLYTPVDFGLFALYTSIINIAYMFATGSYELPVMLPEKHEDSVNVMALSASCTMIVSVIFFIIIFFFDVKICNILKVKETSWLYLVPAGIFFMAIYSIFRIWFNRIKDYKAIAVNFLAESIAGNGSKVIFGVSGLLQYGLIFGQVAGQLLQLILYSRKFIITARQYFKYISFEKIKFLAVEYKEYPLFYISTSILTSATIAAPVFFLNNYFSQTETGYFSLTFRIISLPVSMIAQLFSQIFFQKMSEVNNQKKPIRNYIYKFVLLMTLPGFAILLPLLFFGPDIFVIVFGREWEMSGEFARIMSFAFAARIIIVPVSTAFLVRKRVKLLFLWRLIYFISTCTVLYLFSESNIMNFITAFTCTDIVFFLIYFFLIIKVSEKPIDVNDLKSDDISI